MITFVVLCVASLVVQTTPIVSIEEMLGQRLRTFLEAASHSPASAGDKRIFDEFFADDVVYTRSSGVVLMKRDIMKSLDEPAAAGSPTQVYTGEDVRVRRFDRMAVLTFRLVQRLSDGTVNRYRNTGTFLERNGKWQIVAWQATRMAEP
jgi:uncharacterized protein DUF4440